MGVGQRGGDEDPVPAGTGRRQHLLAAVVAVLLTVGLAIAARYGRPGVVVGVGAAQALLVPAWVLGTGLPGRIGAVVIGLGTAWLVTRGMASMLFEVGPNDPWTLAAVAIVLSAVALAATWLPASRATRVDPMAALRE
jgi:ABC-type lipoprotein release transport system permease subunit